LIKLLKENKVSFNFFDKNNAINDISNAIDIGHQFTPEALAFQTGYLTVDKADYTKDPTGYSLKIPNFEVERSLIIYLLHSNYPGMPNIAAFTDLLESKAKLILRAILEKDASKAAKEFISFMASFSYSLHLSYEAYYMTLFYFVFNLTKQNFLKQESIGGGILDCALEAPNGEIFVGCVIKIM
jgi:hypothetical protein